MIRFAESPVPCLLIGLAVVSILLILYVQTRRAAWALAMLVVALLTVAGVLFERFTVTDREAIENAVYGLAASAEANDLPAVLSYISQEAARARADAEREMSRYEIALARIINAPRIEIFRETSPPTARVHCRGIVKVKDQGQAILDFVLTFAHEEGRWLLFDYTYNFYRNQ